MAKKRRKKRKSRKVQFERGLTRAKPQTWEPIRFKKTALPKVRRTVRAKPEALPVAIYRGKRPTTKVQTKTRPMLSLSSPMACVQKKAAVRREYFAMRGAGKGGKLINKRSRRFTVRC